MLGKLLKSKTHIKTSFRLTKECDWEVQKARDILEKAHEEQSEQNSAPAISNLLPIGLTLMLVGVLNRNL